MRREGKRKRVHVAHLLLILVSMSVLAGSAEAALKVRNGSFESPPLFPAVSATASAAGWPSSSGAVVTHWDLNVGVSAQSAFPCPGLLCAPDGRQVLILSDSGDPANPSSIHQRFSSFTAQPNLTFTFSFVQTQQMNINGEGAGVTIELWQGNPNIAGRTMLDQVTFSATEPGRKVTRRAALETGPTDNPNSYDLYLRLAHAPGFGLPGTSGTGNVIIDDVKLFDPDEDGLEGDKDLCPYDPVPFEWTASTLPAAAGFPRNGVFDGPEPGENQNGNSLGESANWLQFSRGAIPLIGGPNYEECGGMKFEHAQDIAVIGDRLDGHAYYAVTHSQDNHGHFMVFRSENDTVGVSPNEHEVFSLGNPPLNAGAAMDLLNVRDGAGIFYRKYDASAPEGQYNHPGDLARLGDWLLVAAQNWPAGEFCVLNRVTIADRFEIMDGTLTAGFEPDAVLFYDVSDPSTPEYRGKIVIAELPLHPGQAPFPAGEFSTLRVAESGGFVYLFVDALDGRWFRSSELSWYADDWTPVSSPPGVPTGITVVKAAMEVPPLGVKNVGFVPATGNPPAYGIWNPPGATDPQRLFGMAPSALASTTHLEDFWVSPNGRSEYVIANGLGFGDCGGQCFDNIYTLESHTIRYAVDNPVMWPHASGPPDTNHPNLPAEACALPGFTEVGLNEPYDGRVTRDHDTDLDWLDLNETANLSINDLRGGAGGWLAAGWSVATDQQACVLAERATGRDSSLCAGPIGDFGFSGSIYPSLFDRTIAMLGMTKMSPSPAEVNKAGPGPTRTVTICLPPPIGCIDHFLTPFSAPERTHAANGACSPDAQTGICAVQGIHKSGASASVTSLNRGFLKCGAVDVRECMDGMVIDLPEGSPSTCKKCALVNDLSLGAIDLDTSDAQTGIFLVRSVPEADIAFNIGGDTISWPGLDAARSYNVYRGDISNLVDGDGDGLPDAGYGDCRNDLDPDTTDTMLVDSELPEVGAGFFYLISSDTESNLGSTSAGLFRQPTTPCP